VSFDIEPKSSVFTSMETNKKITVKAVHFGDTLVLVPVARTLTQVELDNRRIIATAARMAQRRDKFEAEVGVSLVEYLQWPREQRDQANGDKQ